jgi:uncharacterized protein (DUF2062 family)
VPPRFLRKYQPQLDAVRTHPLVVRYGAWLQHPGLWRFNRKSVAGAVAIGLFSGLVPGPLQMLTALLLAIPLRKNLPVALIVTLYTNPVTIVPLYLLAYGYGRLLLGLEGAGAPPIEPFHPDWSQFWLSMQHFGQWMMQLGKPLALGLPALAITLAAVGYFVVDIGWRIYIIAAWRRRKRRAQ